MSCTPFSLQVHHDVLFDRTFDKSYWEPCKPPQPLGELLDSRFMIPLLFPSDPRHLAALPGKPSILEDNKRTSVQSVNSSTSSERTSIRSLPLHWRSKSRSVREVGIGTLQWVDGLKFSTVPTAENFWYPPLQSLSLSSPSPVMTQVGSVSPSEASLCPPHCQCCSFCPAHCS